MPQVLSNPIQMPATGDRQASRTASRNRRQEPEAHWIARDRRPSNGLLADDFIDVWRQFRQSFHEG
jgi:hypothetical protein